MALDTGPVVVPAGAVPPFFAGLLPEGRRLVALHRALDTSADDVGSLLLAVAHVAIGDVQVVPADQQPSPPERMQPADLARTTFKRTVDAGRQPGLLVARFDRSRSGEVGRRAHVWGDACQLLGRYPADNDRPSTEAVVAGHAAVCGAPVVAARELSRIAWFAYRTCNGDVYAKDRSVLHPVSGEWQPSPACALVAARAYGDATMALTIAGRRRHDMGRRPRLALGAVRRMVPASNITARRCAYLTPASSLDPRRRCAYLTPSPPRR